jgi:hypothetical protein
VPAFENLGERVRQEDSLSASFDTLSAVGRQLLRLDAASAYDALVVHSPGNEIAKTMLEHLTPRDLIDGKIESEMDAHALLSALWLRHDWLEQSHKISQMIETPTGSLWHAIMHRREGDFSNSKYWYRQLDEHPTYGTMAVRAGDIINPFPADKSVFRINFDGWSPAAFVDLVAAVHDKPNDPRHRLAQALQEMEWQTLFEYSTRAASGR